MRIREFTLEKPLLNGSQYGGSGHFSLIDRPGDRLHVQAELRDRRIFEQVANFQLVAGLVQPGGNLNRLDRITAELEEVIRDSDPFGIQHSLPNVGKSLLRFVSGRNILASPERVSLRGRQRLPVDFPVRRQRHPRQLHEMRRNHVTRQVLRQRCSKITNGQRLVSRNVSAQLQSALFFPGDDDRFLYGRNFQKLFFNLAGLDPVAADFHLVVDPAHIFDVPVRKPAGGIPRPVHPFAGGKRVVDELLRRQLGAIQISSRQTDTRNAQFTRYSFRHRLSVLVHDINLVIMNGTADGNRFQAGIIRLSGPDRSDDRSFRRAVGVEIPHFVFPLLHEFGRYGRAPGNQLLQPPHMIRV